MEDSLVTRPADLPDYENPPVNEVAVSLQFGQLAKFRAWHIGRLSDAFGDVQDIQEQPPLFPVYETLPARSQQIQFQLNGPNRYVFQLKEKQYVIQVQTDRFILNWKKTSENDVYPRFENIFDMFEKRLVVFREFLANNGIGEINVTQCELVYVNRIGGMQEEGMRKSLDRIFTGLSPSPSVTSLEFEEGHFLNTYVMRIGADRKFAGRLYLQGDPAADAPDRSVFQLNITARGGPERPMTSGVKEFFYFAREQITRSFDAVTTQEMHNRWRRK